ncbi:alpha/beta fold hydrolase [Rehaibacterium terrae]|uniref:Pimeloyl-ACP methyl ester carboxylesterase n=1 Tax=Rehaibacterium terrae TaxID=1341696 RepID=A0A7W7XYK6_9GAMM|nr:pimeloyl-ACP methyl ester carboxylesterase [Rehaibacterium terrae]
MRRRAGRLLLAGAGVLLAAGLLVALLRPEWLLEGEYARLRWLAGAQEKTLHAAGHRWAYLESGRADAPLIVLVHGFTGLKEGWLPLMRELQDEYRLIAPDLPGWNESERQPGADYGVEAQAERLADFLAALDAPTALLVGHSMGGFTAGLTAAAHPGRVPKLVLMSAAGVRFEINDFARQVLAGEHPFAVTDRASLHRYLALIFSDPPFVPWPVDEALARRRRASLEFEREVLDRTHREPQAFLLETRLHALTMPTLLLWCRDDRVIDVSAADVFAAGLPHSQTVILEGCGHMPPMERPGEVADALRRFAGGAR